MVRCPRLAGTWEGVDHRDDIQDLAAGSMGAFDLDRHDSDIEVLNASEYISAFECAICEEQICHPSRLPCGHSFCRGCLAAVFSARQKSCPLCEADVESNDPDAHPAMQGPLMKGTQSLKRTRTAEYLHRNSGLAVTASTVVYVRVGNRSSINCEGGLRYPQKWTLRVWLDRDVFPFPQKELSYDWTESDLIKKVTFGLVPACRLLDSQDGFLPPTSADPEVFHAPFEITGVSWGLFTATVTVTWKDWLNLPPLQLQHCLTTLGKVGDSTHGVEFGVHGEPELGTLRSTANGVDGEHYSELAPGPPDIPIPGFVVQPPGVVELPLLQVRMPSSVRDASKRSSVHWESTGSGEEIVLRKRRGLAAAKRWLLGLGRRSRAPKPILRR